MVMTESLAREKSARIEALGIFFCTTKKNGKWKDLIIWRPKQVQFQLPLSFLWATQYGLWPRSILSWCDVGLHDGHLNIVTTLQPIIRATCNKQKWFIKQFRIWNMFQKQQPHVSSHLPTPNLLFPKKKYTWHFPFTT
jgi:hypothetical protein